MEASFDESIGCNLSCLSGEYAMSDADCMPYTITRDDVATGRVIETTPDGILEIVGRDRSGPCWELSPRVGPIRFSTVTFYMRPGASSDEAERERELLAAGLLLPHLVPKPDPRAAREQTRREIDALLAADRCPFATARRAAVVASVEVQDVDGAKRDVHLSTRSAGRLIAALHEYEALRGGNREPSAAAKAFAGDMLDPVEVGAYERARGLP